MPNDDRPDGVDWAPANIDRSWVSEAVRLVEADANRSADTHLHVLPLPVEWGIDVYLKDESVHPTGSLKHRLARSLFSHALANGNLREGMTVIEASSGSTAVSEAYFARLLGLPFVAVVPASTSPAKLELIEFYGGSCRLVDDPGSVYEVSHRLAERTDGYFIDQFTYAERATDWRGNNNIAESIYGQIARERYPVPDWIVVGAGTGGTAATIGRYARFKRHRTGLCVVDPEGSAYFDAWSTGRWEVTAPGSRIEGIGRPRVEESFLPNVVDAMIRVPDAATVAAMRWTSAMIGRRVGGSTGTNMWGVLRIVADMLRTGRTGSIVTLICDGGERYADTYYADRWVGAQGLDPAPYAAAIDALVTGGTVPAALTTGGRCRKPHRDTSIPNGRSAVMLGPRRG